MRLVQYRRLGAARLGAVVQGSDVGEEIVDLLAARVILSEQGGLRGRLGEPERPRDLAELLARGDAGVDDAREIVQWVTTLGPTDRKALRDDRIVTRMDDVVVLPPVSPMSTVWCLGLNYESHAAEAKTTLPRYPEVFMKNLTAIVGHNQSLVRPSVSTQLDWQGELGVIIGKPAHLVHPDRALDYVAGYTCFNDGSVRDYQKRGPFPAPGKNFACAGSAGPWLVTKDEIPDPHTLAITTRVNDDVVQSDHTSQMWFTVEAIVRYLSEFTVLQPGDVIATGTPGGVGVCLSPQRFLTPGDVLTVEIERIGTLRNSVIDETVRP